ncbi:DUF1491 family protein [Glacieibacterium sp.]|uniref:DUF1491 family protein n=1 Tax=Glacieibacterium sp. TaxID=2860237 RepID=UPI003B004D41
MTEPRLAAGLWVNALIRRVNAAGGFATVLNRGDAVAGSIAIVHRGRGGETRALQRVLDVDGKYSWKVAATDVEVDSWLQRQRNYDPDLWIIELDTPDAARFVDETSSMG